jgi:protoporphyrinogen oxidase
VQPITQNYPANAVFVGAGLPSLLIAKILQARGIQNILVIEKSDRVGGQFQSITYDNDATFDLGMHIYYETGIEEIDRSFQSILEEEEWHYLENNRKDIAGIFYKNRIQKNSPYPDLREYSQSKKHKFLQSITSTLFFRRLESEHSAKDQLENHFGEYLAKRIFLPILKNLYRVPAKDIHSLALKLTAINRVVLLDESEIDQLRDSSFFKERIAYPDQLTMPYVRKNSFKGLYPKKFGFGRLVEKLKTDLVNSGVIFFENTTVTGCEITDQKITKITAKNIKGSSVHVTIQGSIIWTTDVFNLARLLNIETPKSRASNIKKRYINFLLEGPTEIDALYYLYNFDSKSRIFRVTNYAGYCADSITNGLYPICVEYWSDSRWSDSKIMEKCKLDLVRMRVIKSQNQIKFEDLLKMPIPFPSPTIDSVSKVTRLMDEISHRGISNLHITGALSSPKVFFLHEVLIDAYYKLMAKGDK